MLYRRGVNAARTVAVSATNNSTAVATTALSGDSRASCTAVSVVSPRGGGAPLRASASLFGGGATKKKHSDAPPTAHKGAVSAVSLPRVSLDGMAPNVAASIAAIRAVAGVHIASVVELDTLASAANDNANSLVEVNNKGVRIERIIVFKMGARGLSTSRILEYAFQQSVSPDNLRNLLVAAIDGTCLHSSTTATESAASHLVQMLTTIARRQGTSEVVAVSMADAMKVRGTTKRPTAISAAEALMVETPEQREECEEVLRQGYVLLNQVVRSVFNTATEGSKRLGKGDKPFSPKETAAYITTTRNHISGVIVALGRLIGEKKTGATDQQRSRIFQSFTSPYAELCNLLSPLGADVTDHAAAHDVFYGTVASEAVIHQLTASFEPVDRSLYLLTLSALLNGSGIKNPVTTMEQIPPILESLIRNGIAASYLVRSPFIATMTADKVRALITAATALCSSMAGSRLVPRSLQRINASDEGDFDGTAPDVPSVQSSNDRGGSLNHFHSNSDTGGADGAVAASAAKSGTAEVLFPPFANEILGIVRKLYSVKTTLGKQSSDVRNLTPLTRDDRLELTANMLLHGHMSEANLLTATHVAVMRYQLRERQNSSEELPMAHYFSETVRSLINLEEKVCAAIAVAKASVIASGDQTVADKARRMAAEIEVRRTREMCRMGLSNAMGTYTSFLTELTTKLLFLSKDQSTKAEAHEQMRLVYEALKPYATRLVAVAMIADSSRTQNSTIPTFGTLVAALQTTCPTLIAEAMNGGLAETGTTTGKLDSSVLGWAAESISQLNSDVLNSVGTVASQEVTEGFVGRTHHTPLEGALLMYHTPTVNVKGSTRALVREFSTGGILRPLLFYILEQSSALPDAGMHSTDAIAKALSRMGSGGVASLDYRDFEEGAKAGPQNTEVVVEVAINLTTSVTMQALNAYNFAAHFAASPDWEDAVAKWLARFDIATLSHLLQEFARLERYAPADSEKALQCHWRHILIKAMLQKWESSPLRKSTHTTADDLVSRALSLHDVTYLLMGDASGSAPLRPSADVPNALVACSEQLKTLLHAARALPTANAEHASVMLHVLSTTLVNLAKVPSEPGCQEANGAALHTCLVMLLPTTDCSKKHASATFRTHRDVLSFLSHLRDASSGAASSLWLAEPTAQVVHAFTSSLGAKDGLTPSEIIHLLDASTTGYLVPTLGAGQQGGRMIMPVETRRMCLQLITQRLLPAQPLEAYSVAESLAIIRSLCAVYNSTRLAATNSSLVSDDPESALLSTATACNKIIKLIQLVVSKGLIDRPVPADMLLDDRSASHVPLKSWEVSAALATVSLYFPTDVVDIPAETVAAAGLMTTVEVRALRQQLIRRFIPFVLHAKLHLSPQDVMLCLYSLIAGGAYHATCIGGLLQRVNDLKGQFDISSTLALVECGTLAERMAEGNRTTIDVKSATAPTDSKGSSPYTPRKAQHRNKLKGGVASTMSAASAGSGIEFNADSHNSISLATSASQSIQRACYANASSMLRLCVQSLLETNPDLLLSATARGGSSGSDAASMQDGTRSTFRITPYFQSVLLSRSRLTADDAAHRSATTTALPVHSAESLSQKIFSLVDDTVASAATIATGAALQFHERRQRGSAVSSGQVHALFQRQRVQTDVSGLRIIHAILKACPVDLVADTTLDVIASRINEVTSVDLIKEVLRLLRAKGSSDPHTLDTLTSFTAKLVSAPSWHHVASTHVGQGPQLVCVPIGEALELAHLLLRIGARRDEVVTLLTRRLRAKTGATLGGPVRGGAAPIQERELHKLDIPGTVSLVNLFRETQRDELGDLIRAVLVERLPETLPPLTGGSLVSSFVDAPQPYSITTAQCLATLSGSIHTFVKDPVGKRAVLVQLLAFACGKTGPHRQSFVPLLSYNEIRTMMLAVDDSEAMLHGDNTIPKLFLHQCVREVLRRFHGAHLGRQWEADGVEATDGRYCSRVFDGIVTQQTSSNRPANHKAVMEAVKNAKNTLKVRLRPEDFLKKQRLDHAVEATGSLPDIGMATMLLCQLLKLRLGEAAVATSTLSSAATRAASDLVGSMPPPPPDTEVLPSKDLALTAASLAAAAGDLAVGGGATNASRGAFLVPSTAYGADVSTLDAAIERDGAACVRVLLSHVYRYRQAMLSRLTLLEKLRAAVRGTIQFKGEVSIKNIPSGGADKKAKVFHKKSLPTSNKKGTDETITSLMSLSENRTSALAELLPADKQSYVEVLHPQLFEVIVLSSTTQ